MTADPGADAAAEPAQRGMGVLTALVAGGTMLSRVLGLVREVIFAALFGAGAVADAFFIAFFLPNLLRDLFAEGVLSSAFVPTYTDVLKNQGRQAAFRLANIVIGAVLVVVGGITVLGMIFAPELVAALAAEFTPWQQDLTTLCTRIVFPFLLFLSLASIVMGQLNSQEIFGPSAIASATYNLIVVSGGILLLFLDEPAEGLMLGWCCGVIAGGFGQLCIQVPALLRTGFRVRPRLHLRDPGLWRVIRLMGPATVGLAGVQLNIVLGRYFAAQEPGALSWLNYSFRLIYLPIGVFGVAIATIGTARLAQRAAARDMPGLRDTLGRGLRLVAFLTVPSTMGLAVLAEPITRLLFERGEFTAADTAATAPAMVLMALALYAYSSVKVTAPAFYALNMARVPMIASLSGVGIYMVIALTAFPVYGYKALAGGTAVSSAVNCSVLYMAARGATGGFSLRSLAGHFARVTVAAVPCGAASWWVAGTLTGALGTEGFVARAVVVVGAILAGMLAYAFACRLLRIDELDDLTGYLRTKLARAD